MTETQWTGVICSELKDLGAHVLSITASKMQQPGVPDRIITHVVCGTVWCEFKGINTKLRTDQRLFMKEVQFRGGTVCIIRQRTLSGQQGYVEGLNGVRLAEFEDARQLLVVLSQLPTKRARPKSGDGGEDRR